METDKNVVFTRFGGMRSTTQPVFPGDDVSNVIERVRDELALEKTGSWILIDKETNAQILGDVYAQVEDLGNVLVTSQDTGGA